MSSWLWNGTALSQSGELIEFHSCRTWLGCASAHKLFLDLEFPLIKCKILHTHVKITDPKFSLYNQSESQQALFCFVFVLNS